jgi:16S rRNA (guanine527-N7)-methyltransferase
MSARRKAGPGAVMDESWFTGALLSLARNSGIPFTPEQAGLIFQHIALMLEWNRTINLTRITDPADILARHVLDSLIPGRWLPGKGRILDVGSGAGFPGVVLKILAPEVHMTLVESHRKKISFLRVLLSRLNLQDMVVMPSRWEEISLDVSQGRIPRWDAITMRAVRLEAQHLAHLAARLLNPGGSFAFWAGVQGRSIAEQFDGDAQKAGLTLQGCLPYQVPSLEKVRYLLLWKREA